MISEQDPTIDVVIIDEQRRDLLDRVRQLAASGQYGALLALALLEVPDEAVLEVAVAKRDQLLAHDDAHLNTPIHQRIRPFVEGTPDGSALDAETTNPHSLSNFKINFGSTSLRPQALRLADATSVTDDDRRWVREQALVLLRSDERGAVRIGAAVLLQQHEVNGAGLEPGLLAAHPEPIVRQLASITACAQPDSYASVLRTRASDPSGSVRDVLARELRRHARGDSSAIDVTNEVLAKLADDIRHSVRRTAAGADDG